MRAAAAASIRSCHVIPTLGGHNVWDPYGFESELSVVVNLVDSLVVPGGAGRVVVAPIGLVAFDLCFFMDGVVFYWWHGAYCIPMSTKKALTSVEKSENKILCGWVPIQTSPSPPPP